VTDVDPFVVDAVQALAARDRALAQRDLEIFALVTALARYEGGDVAVTALAHLGRTLEVL
jgi:hypothetical protein